MNIILLGRVQIKLQLKPPEYVFTVLNTLNNHGYSAYLVGGCVRDFLLNTVPSDWDIASSALPEQVLSLFPDSLTIGMKHGTITVKQGKNLVEVTTFRLDGQYADHRHPEQVQFVSDLAEDLSRRDFTINAIAMDKDGKIVDPFHGQKDLNHGIIRAVGNPDLRFEEDALRMFRAFRFSSRLGFSIEKETLDAIYKNASLASSLSAERVRDELVKILCSSHPEYLQKVISCGLLNRFLVSQETDLRENLKLLTALEAIPSLRLTLACFFMQSVGLLENVMLFLTELKLSGETIRQVSEGCMILHQPEIKNKADVKRLLSKYNFISVQNALQCIDCLFKKNTLGILQEVLSSGECYAIKNLDVHGADLLSLGFRGKEVGVVLDTLLTHVIDFPEDNTRSVLLGLARNLKETQC